MIKQILYCQCKSDILPENRKHQLAEFLESSRVPVINLHDLCGLCAEKKDTVKELFSENSSSLVIACHERTINALLDFAGIDTGKVNVKTLNARELSENELESEISTFALEGHSNTSVADVAYDSDWPSWFPVIDYERCVGCGQCADFCLFGAYTKKENTVYVENPQACKNNCPACARICPHTAIIFPKYKQGGAIGGSSSIDEQAELERQRKDANEILGSDIYKALAQRKAKRQRIIQEKAMNTALKEREEALGEVKKNNIFNPFRKNNSV